MKRRNYIVLMVIGIIAMVLTTVVPCKAKWIWIGSEVASGPWSGKGGDIYWEWWFSVTDINTSANSSGASASARCQAYIYAHPDSFGGTVARGDSVYCTSWGRSIYYDDDPPNPLDVTWSVSGSGHVKVWGSVYDGYMHDDDTGSSSASAYGEIESYEYGNGYAGGSVTRGSNGSAYIYWDGHATENSNDVDNGDPNSYGAELYYSVSGSGSDTLEDETRFTARAEVQSSASSNASVTVIGTPYWGMANAYAYSDTNGNSSVSVSW